MGADDAAVVIGIDDYAFVPDAIWAERDAQAFHGFLLYTRGVPADRIALLTGNVTHENIGDAVDEAAGLAGSEGTLWVYFAGHGSASPFDQQQLWLGVDVQSRVEEVDNRGIRVAEVQRRAEASAAKRIVLVQDACASGYGRAGAAVPTAKRLLGFVGALPESNRVTLWSATDDNQLADAYPAVEHGAFTYFAVGALRGWADGEVSGKRDRVVTLGEAQAYVRRMLRVAGFRSQTASREDREGWEAVPLAQGSLDRGPKDEAVKGTAPGDQVAYYAEIERLRAEEAAAATDAERRRAEVAQLRRAAEEGLVAARPLVETGSEQGRQALERFLEYYGAVEVGGQRVALEPVEEARRLLAAYEVQGSDRSGHPGPSAWAGWARVASTTAKSKPAVRSRVTKPGLRGGTRSLPRRCGPLSTPATGPRTCTARCCKPRGPWRLLPGVVVPPL